MPRTLLTFPFIIVQIACRRCPRKGQYRLARLVESYGADTALIDLLDALALDCEIRQKHNQPGISRCGAHYPDLSEDRPPDVPVIWPKVSAARKRDER